MNWLGAESVKAGRYGYVSILLRVIGRAATKVRLLQAMLFDQLADYFGNFNAAYTGHAVVEQYDRVHVSLALLYFFNALLD